MALLRSAAAECGISDISQKGRFIDFTLAGDSVCLPSLTAVCGMKSWFKRLRMGTGSIPTLTLTLQKGEQPMEWATRLVEDLQMKRRELMAASNEEKKGNDQ